jgi:hypothetical protein
MTPKFNSQVKYLKRISFISFILQPRLTNEWKWCSYWTLPSGEFVHTYDWTNWICEFVHRVRALNPNLQQKVDTVTTNFTPSYDINYGKIFLMFGGTSTTSSII